MLASGWSKEGVHRPGTTGERGRALNGALLISQVQQRKVAAIEFGVGRRRLCLRGDAPRSSQIREAKRA